MHSCFVPQVTLNALPWHTWGFITSHLFQCCSNFIDPDAICWPYFNSSQYPMVPFILFNHQFFRVFLPWIFNLFRVYSHLSPLPDTPFRLFSPLYPNFLLASALISNTFYFDVYDHLNHLHIPSVCFPLLWNSLSLHFLYFSLLLPRLCRVFKILFWHFIHYVKIMVVN